MKIQSKPLHEYLSRSGALGGSEEDIARAKKIYRKEYKRLWKKRRDRHKEVRIELTLKQFRDLQVAADRLQLRHTTYARETIVSASNGRTFIPHRDCLLRVLQTLSMCTIAAMRNTAPPWALADQLQKAERLLLDYLGKEER
jgi:hypothetical protein